MRLRTSDLGKRGKKRFLLCMKLKTRRIPSCLHIKFTWEKGKKRVEFLRETTQNYELNFACRVHKKYGENSYILEEEFS